MIDAQTRKKLKSQLILEEDEKLFAYKDSVGKTTIGIGRNLDDKGISNAESNIMCDNDITFFDNALHSALAFYDDLEPVRKIVLIDMAFNLGMDRFMAFQKMLHAIAAKDYKTASLEITNSYAATQDVSRYKRLEQEMLTGIWASDIV